MGRSFIFGVRRCSWSCDICGIRMSGLTWTWWVGRCFGWILMSLFGQCLGLDLLKSGYWLEKYVWIANRLRFRPWAAWFTWFRTWRRHTFPWRFYRLCQVRLEWTVLGLQYCGWFIFWGHQTLGWLYFFIFRFFSWSCWGCFLRTSRVGQILAGRVQFIKVTARDVRTWGMRIENGWWWKNNFEERHFASGRWNWGNGHGWRARRCAYIGDLVYGFY